MKSHNLELWLFQGTLEKYKPGFTRSFYPKWFTVSKSTLAYYRDKWSANCFMDNPLFTIPMSCISSVKWVPVAVPEEGRRRRGKRGGPDPHNFQFEIVLREKVRFSGVGRPSNGYDSALPKGYVAPIEDEGQGAHFQEVPTFSCYRGS